MQPVAVRRWSWSPSGWSRDSARHSSSPTALRYSPTRFPSRRGEGPSAPTRSAISIGSVLGLVLGGFLTTAAGWRSIFWVNVPIGIVATLVGALPPQGALREEERTRSWTFRATLLFAAGVIMLLAGISLYAVAGLGESLYRRAGRRRPRALWARSPSWRRRSETRCSSSSLFRNRLFAAGTIAIFLNSLARGCVLLVLVFYLQGPNMNLDPLAGWPVPATEHSDDRALAARSRGISRTRGGRGSSPRLGSVTTAVGLLMLAQLPCRRHVLAARPSARPCRRGDRDIRAPQQVIGHELRPARGQGPRRRRSARR